MDAPPEPRPEYPPRLRGHCEAIRREQYRHRGVLSYELWQMQAEGEWSAVGYPTFDAFCESEFGWRRGYLTVLMHGRKEARPIGERGDRRRLNARPMGTQRPEVEPNLISQPLLFGTGIDWLDTTHDVLNDVGEFESWLLTRRGRLQGDESADRYHAYRVAVVAFRAALSEVRAWLS